MEIIEEINEQHSVRSVSKFIDSSDSEGDFSERIDMLNEADDDDATKIARKAYLEKRWRRKLVWGSASSAVYIGSLLQFFGIRGAHYQVLRKFMSFLAGEIRHHPHVDCQVSKIANVDVRIYRPATRKSLAKLPCLVYLHGGGWMVGSAESYHPLTNRLCKDTESIVISVDFRLAPEHPYPAALDDCLSVVRAILDCDLGKFEDCHLPWEIDASMVALAGDSAGGNLAATVALDLLRMNDDRLFACAMICPVTQVSTMQHSSAIQYRPKYGRANLGWFLSIYAGVTPNSKILKSIYNDKHVTKEHKDKYFDVVYSNRSCQVVDDCVEKDDHVPDEIFQLATNPRAWPLLAEGRLLAKLPKMFVQSCSHDVLRDENFRFVERLRLNGTKSVTHSHMLRAQHVESINCGVFRSKASRQGYREIIDFFKSIFNE